MGTVYADIPESVTSISGIARFPYQTKACFMMRNPTSRNGMKRRACA